MVSYRSRSGLRNYTATSTYDAADQQLQLFDGTTLHTFTYDGAGNQLQARAGAVWPTSRARDDENRPTRDETKVSILPATVTTLTYDGSGLLVRRQQGASESKLVWDNQNLLLETDGANATQAMYTLEPLGFGNLVSMRRKVGGNWTRRYYHFNNIGTTDRLTDETQTVTDRYQLDPWGRTLLAATGTTVNPFRYIGRLGYYHYTTSSVTDAYYVRARHYQPLYWRWWSRDPVEISRSLARSLNLLGTHGKLYAYSASQPLLRVDPSGRIVQAGGALAACGAGCIIGGIGGGIGGFLGGGFSVSSAACGALGGAIQGCCTGAFCTIAPTACTAGACVCGAIGSFAQQLCDGSFDHKDPCSWAALILGGGVGCIGGLSQSSKDSLIEWLTGLDIGVITGLCKQL